MNGRRGLRAIFASLLLWVALLSPALGQDGPRDAANAKEAAQALKLYLDEVSKSGRRPDYTKPPASELLRRVFDLEKLSALPPPDAGDMPWMLEWGDAANQSNKLILLFGSKPGAGGELDQAAIARNVADYEDQYAAALAFIIRFQARQAPTMLLFLDRLPPEQRTPVREAGLQKARGGAAEMIAGAVISVAPSMKPANARAITAALRDTKDVWATFLVPADRTKVGGVLARARILAKDDETQKNLATFAAALAAAK